MQSTRTYHLIHHEEPAGLREAIQYIGQTNGVSVTIPENEPSYSDLSILVLRAEGDQVKLDNFVFSLEAIGGIQDFRRPTSGQRFTFSQLVSLYQDPPKDLDF
jgi:hypothetical protein